MQQVEQESEQIQKIRRIINEFPLEKDLPPDIYDRHLVRQYRHFVQNVAMYIRAVDFTYQDEVYECYNFLETSE